MFIINQSVVDPCQFLNPRNCPPQAPKMYVYAYIVHFWTHQRRGRASDNNWGGASDINWGEGGGAGELRSTTSKSNFKKLHYVHTLGGTTCSTLLVQWRFLRFSTFSSCRQSCFRPSNVVIKRISCRRAHWTSTVEQVVPPEKHKWFSCNTLNSSDV